jgi:hypothetical protein
MVADIGASFAQYLWRLRCGLHCAKIVTAIVRKREIVQKPRACPVVVLPGGNISYYCARDATAGFCRLAAATPIREGSQYRAQERGKKAEGPGWNGERAGCRRGKHVGSQTPCMFRGKKAKQRERDLCSRSDGAAMPAEEERVRAGESQVPRALTAQIGLLPRGNTPKQER